MFPTIFLFIPPLLISTIDYDRMCISLGWQSYISFARCSPKLFLLRGDKSQDQTLQSGDTIFVPVIGPVAGVAGNVRRPAIYEIKAGVTLQRLLEARFEAVIGTPIDVDAICVFRQPARASPFEGWRRVMLAP